MLVHLRAKFAHQDEAARVHKIQHRTAWAVPGRFEDRTGQFHTFGAPESSCKACGKGRYEDSRSSIECKACAAGRFAKLQEV